MLLTVLAFGACGTGAINNDAAEVWTLVSYEANITALHLGRTDFQH